MTELADRLLGAVQGIRRVVRRRVRADVPGSPLPGAQVELLRVVADRPGIGVAAAARELHLANNSVSTLVNQLADAGLLRREADPADRRAARLEITAAAAERMAAWRRARTGLVADALAKLSEEDIGAIGHALPVLEKLVGILKEQP
ncbi:MULTISPECIES: MarR family transcriptional regulator [unclassified Amycolatopsis]|uniref:MarR family winged helix-turn-helix transcriptional regulator n=1 Tax=unclassified Amycolatopsis TaxID=2618356 RepID=UPI00287497F1|nr:MULTISPECIES: MarR family transcriptional regulator [unclassified Amycolatopsis]MDS0140449.1 MarR family transcriptional regulator [Amycolatopsis sp. 505]MDS0149454.1 MarR family transcriptional regulator [Amycolatopsis sp. CM201R]